MTELTPEPGRGLGENELPSYAEALHAFHAAAASELSALHATLPLSPRSLVLDLACGDGCHGVRMAERAGRVVGLDRSSAYLHAARARGPASVVQANAAALPFADGTFDLAFCAHSLGSLPDHRAALAELARVTGRDGWIAILESDPLHRVLMPWDPRLELEVRRAQLDGLEALAREHGMPLDKFTCARRLDRLLSSLGFDDCRLQTLVVERRSPLGPDEELFLRGYLADVRARASPHLGGEHRRALEALTSPDSPAYLPRQTAFRYLQLETLALARR